ncbi:DUF423 domain-containing protein [Tenacibaculum geojense]|uniref:DUF423 domain-containing protein n=1 Tax=Tenacibaculum geojense TaxID=915352 RepID=A0ABW3JTA8_9FLAO
MYKNLTIGAAFGMLAVVLGAFGAHALKKILTLEALNSFETAVRYQIYHAIVLLFVASFKGFSPKQSRSLTLLFSLGVVLFSGSIYAIYLLGIPAKNIWFITPLGGMVLVVAWLVMLAIFFKNREKK